MDKGHIVDQLIRILPDLVYVVGTFLCTYLGYKYKNKANGKKITESIEGVVKSLMVVAEAWKEENANKKLTCDQENRLNNMAVTRAQEMGINLPIEKIVKEVRHAVEVIKERKEGK